MLIPPTQEVKGICALVSCGKPLPPRRRRWCSDKCSKYYFNTIYNNHDWNSARKAAKRRDKWKCVQCGSKIKLEVNHIKACLGKRGFGCQHHLSNLETLCREHHLIKTKEQRDSGVFRR